MTYMGMYKQRQPNPSALSSFYIIFPLVRWFDVHGHVNHCKSFNLRQSPSPIGSMYGICANIGGILMVNVTIYSIDGSYGLWIQKNIPNFAGNGGKNITKWRLTNYWVHTIRGFGCQAFQHVLLLGVTATPPWKNPSRLLRNSPVRRAGTYTMRGVDWIGYRLGRLTTIHL